MTLIDLHAQITRESLEAFLNRTVAGRDIPLNDFSAWRVEFYIHTHIHTYIHAHARTTERVVPRSHDAYRFTRANYAGVA